MLMSLWTLKSSLLTKHMYSMRAYFDRIKQSELCIETLSNENLLF